MSERWGDCQADRDALDRYLTQTPEEAFGDEEPEEGLEDDGEPAGADTPMGIEDDGGEPYDIDSDEGFDPYAGGPEQDGYDTGWDGDYSEDF